MSIVKNEPKIKFALIAAIREQLEQRAAVFSARPESL